MCQHRKSGNVMIDEGILDIFLDTLIKHQLIKPEDLENLKTKAVKDRLSFEADETIGEGSASEEELAYRQQLLDLLKELYDDVIDIINSNKEPLKKIKQIDNLIDIFIDEGQDIVNEVIPKTWDDGIDESIDTLNDIDDSEDYDTDNIDTSKRDLILQQQLMNIEDIGLRLRGRIRQSLLVTAIKTHDEESTKKSKTIKQKAKKYPASYTPCMIQIAQEDPNLTEDELREICLWESGFAEAEENTDKMGVWGYLNANKEAILAGLIMGTAITGDLIADWETVGDNNVCEECQDLEANSPYSILKWPSEPHFGCRCKQENVRLASLE
jgi:hypothetical protein